MFIIIVMMVQSSIIKKQGSCTIMLTRTAVQANLQVTEDSSFKVFCSRGMQSARENGFPAQKSKKQHLHVTQNVGLLP